MAKMHYNGWNKGLNRAKQPHEVDVTELVRASDCVRRFERWVRRDGFTLPYTAITDGFNVTALTDFLKRSQSAYLIAGNKDGLWRLNGTSWQQRLNLGTSVTDKDKWFFAEINDTHYAVNKAATEVYQTTDPSTTNYTAVTWDVTTDADGETGVDIQEARVILALNQRLWFFDVKTNVDGDIPEMVRWTQVNDFDRSETTDFLNLSGSHSRILSAGTLLNQLIGVYREDVVNIIQNPGVPVATVRATYEPGIVGSYAWTHIPGGGHFYVAKNGFFIFNGGYPQPLGRDKMTEYYLGLVNEQYYENTHCWTNFSEEEIIIGVPTTSGIPGNHIVYNWAKGVWSEWNLESWCGFYRHRQQTGHSVFFGQESGNVALQGGTTDGGTAITPILRTKNWKHVPLNQVHESFDIIQVNRVQHDIVETVTDDVTVKIAGLDYGTEDPTSKFASYNIEELSGWMDGIAVVPVVGQYIVIQIEGFESVSEVVLDFTASSTI